MYCIINGFVISPLSNLLLIVFLVLHNFQTIFHVTISWILNLVKKNPGHHPLSNNPEIQSIIQAKMVSTLKRPLTQYESDILVYPRLCMVCLNGLQVTTEIKLIFISYVFGKNYFNASLKIAY